MSNPYAIQLTHHSNDYSLMSINPSMSINAKPFISNPIINNHSIFFLNCFILLIYHFINILIYIYNQF